MKIYNDECYNDNIVFSDDEISEEFIDLSSDDDFNPFDDSDLTDSMFMVENLTTSNNLSISEFDTYIDKIKNDLFDKDMEKMIDAEDSFDYEYPPEYIDALKSLENQEIHQVNYHRNRYAECAGRFFAKAKELDEYSDLVYVPHIFNIRWVAIWSELWHNRHINNADCANIFKVVDVYEYNINEWFI